VTEIDMPNAGPQHHVPEGWACNNIFLHCQDALTCCQVPCGPECWGGVCSNTQEDENNCGGCSYPGNPQYVCGPGEACFDGQCIFIRPPP
jgi:hypothetical protein